MIFRLDKLPIVISEEEALELGAKRVTLKEDEHSRFVIETDSNEELILFY